MTVQTDRERRPYSESEIDSLQIYFNIACEQKILINTFKRKLAVEQSAGMLFIFTYAGQDRGNYFTKRNRNKP